MTQRRITGSRSVTAALALAAVLLAALTGYRLLSVCGFSVPLSNYVIQTCRPDTPPVAPADASAPQSGVRGLRAQLLALDTRLQLQPACDLPEPVIEPEAEPDDEIIERVIEEGGSTGALNIMLQWLTLDDLDLHVECPSGRTISYRNKRNCGGLLDVDMNAGSGSKKSNAVENVVFEQGSVPSGEFTVRVNRYKAVSGTLPGKKTPFRVLVTRQTEDGRSRVLLDVNDAASKPLGTVGSFTIP